MCLCFAMINVFSCKLVVQSIKGYSFSPEIGTIVKNKGKVVPVLN
jgi:hypothetical protein